MPRVIGRRSVGAPGLRHPIWTDRWAVTLILLAVGLDGALAFTLWQRFDTLPELITLHFNAYGEADLIGGKSEIFRLPLIGAIIWASNAVLAILGSPYDRVVARTVLGAAVVVQAIFCVAAWRIVT